MSWLEIIGLVLVLVPLAVLVVVTVLRIFHICCADSEIAWLVGLGLMATLGLLLLKWAEKP